MAKASGAHLRVHYKNAVEVAGAIRHMPLERAKTYLNNVLQHKEAIPFMHFKSGRGRHAQVRVHAVEVGGAAPAHRLFRLPFAQAKNLAVPGSLSGWPRNATKMVLSLVQNAEANAKAKGLATEDLVLQHTQVNMAPKGRRRTYRAHGRIGPYLNVPAHIEMILVKKPEQVAKSESKPSVPRLGKRVLAKRVKPSDQVVVGGGMPSLEKA